MGTWESRDMPGMHEYASAVVGVCSFRLHCFSFFGDSSTTKLGEMLSENAR
jgi:hypothetical protein